MTADIAPPPAPDESDTSDGTRLGTSSRGSRIVGALALLTLAATALYGLVLSPADEVQGDAARLLYLHVPVAIAAYLGFAITAVSSIVWLRRRTEFWDLLAGASAEVGVVFTGLCLLTGMLWGRPIWGVYWVWDARLTSTLMLFILFIGYLALRRVLVGTPNRAKWSAVAGIVAAIDVPIVHESVNWWRTQHQTATLSATGSQIGGLMLFSLMLGMVGMVLLFWWLLIHRFRLQYLEARIDEIGLDQAIALRRAEASGHPGPLAAGGTR